MDGALGAFLKSRGGKIKKGCWGRSQFVKEKGWKQMSGRHRGLPTGNAQLYKKSKGGAGGPRATEHIKSGGEKRLAYFLLSRFLFLFFHAYNTPRKYGANRSSGGGGGGVVWVGKGEGMGWGGAK